MCELLADINGLYLTDQNLCILRHINAGQLCDIVGRLSNDLCI